MRRIDVPPGWYSSYDKERNARAEAENEELRRKSRSAGEKAYCQAINEHNCGTQAADEGYHAAYDQVYSKRKDEAAAVKFGVDTAAVSELKTVEQAEKAKSRTKNVRIHEDPAEGGKLEDPNGEAAIWGEGYKHANPSIDLAPCGGFSYIASDARNKAGPEKKKQRRIVQKRKPKPTRSELKWSRDNERGSPPRRDLVVTPQRNRLGWAVSTPWS